MKSHILFITVVVAFFWVLLYCLNHIIFRFTELTPITSLIFIPSGYKIAVVSVFRIRAWLGLFLGALITGYLFLNGFSWIDIVTFSFFSSTLPLIAFKLGEYWISLKSDLSNLRIKHVVLISLIYAVLNGYFHVTYRYRDLFMRNGIETHEILSMMVGDILGILIAMLILSKLSKFQAIKNYLNK